MLSLFAVHAHWFIFPLLLLWGRERLKYNAFLFQALKVYFGTHAHRGQRARDLRDKLKSEKQSQGLPQGNITEKGLFLSSLPFVCHTLDNPL